MDKCTYFYPNDTAPLMEPFIPQNLTTLKFIDSKMRYDITVNIHMTPTNNMIEYLDVSGIAFHLLTGTVGPFPHLKYLALSRCYCSWIGPDFLAPTIETLQLDQNYLGEMFASIYGLNAIDGLFNLKVLNLYTNVSCCRICFAAKKSSRRWISVLTSLNICK